MIHKKQKEENSSPLQILLKANHDSKPNVTDVKERN